MLKRGGLRPRNNSRTRTDQVAHTKCWAHSSDFKHLLERIRQIGLLKLYVLFFNILLAVVLRLDDLRSYELDLTLPSSNTGDFQNLERNFHQR